MRMPVAYACSGRAGLESPGGTMKVATPAATCFTKSLLVVAFAIAFPPSDHLQSGQ